MIICFSHKKFSQVVYRSGILSAIEVIHAVFEIIATTEFTTFRRMFAIRSHKPNLIGITFS